jgi:hypothetical protein
MKRPTGVTIIAILLWIVGVSNVIVGVAAIDELSAFAGLVQVAIGAAAVVFGIGCWGLRRWARSGTIVLMGLNALSIIVIWIQYGDRIVVGRVLFPLIVNVVVILYLFQATVREAFEG